MCAYFEMEILMPYARVATALSIESIWTSAIIADKDLDGNSIIGER